jgi:hypothetical protein
LGRARTARECSAPLADRNQGCPRGFHPLRQHDRVAHDGTRISTLHRQSQRGTHARPHDGRAFRRPDLPQLRSWNGRAVLRILRPETRLSTGVDGPRTRSVATLALVRRPIASYSPGAGDRTRASGPGICAGHARPPFPPAQAAPGRGGAARTRAGARELSAVASVRGSERSGSAIAPSSTSCSPPTATH